MKEKQIKNWEKIRNTNRSLFAVHWSVLRWGVFMAISFSIIMQLIQPQEPIWKRPLIAMVIFPIMGYFFGLYIWAIRERKYQQYIDKNVS